MAASTGAVNLQTSPEHIVIGVVFYQVVGL